MINKNFADIARDSSMVIVTDENLKAYLNLKSPIPGVSYERADLEAILSKNKILYGIRTNVLDEILEKNWYDKDILVAQGDKATDGSNGQFLFHFRTEINRKPKLLADGSVDYRNIETPDTVTEGAVIAEYVPAVKGQNGMDVHGRPIICKAGKELQPLKGKGFSVSSDKCCYTANIDGQVEYTNDRLVVSNVMEINQDLDYTCSDINFSGDVVVNGSIGAGMTVTAGGSIIVKGSVEVVQLTAGKDVILSGGMQGAGRGIINAGGNVSGKFFEQVIIRAKGSIYANAVMNCDMSAEQEVVVSGKLGVIVGGSTKAIAKVEATMVGNMAEVKTLIMVGAGDETFAAMIELQNNIKLMEEEIEKIAKGIQRITDRLMANANPLLSEKRILLLRSKISKETELRKMAASRDHCLELLDRSIKACIVVHKTLHGGVTVGIGGVRLLNKEEHSNLIIKKKGQEVCLFAADP